MKLYIAVMVHNGLVEQAKACKSMAKAYAFIAEHLSLPTHRRKDVQLAVEERNTSGKWTIQIIIDNITP